MSSIDREDKVPLIHVTLIENLFSQTQKQEMIQKLTDAMVSIEGEKLRSLTWVVIEEFKDGNLAIGGKPLSSGDTRELSGGKKLST
jgi:4-oxalocrotonate tautomerase